MPMPMAMSQPSQSPEPVTDHSDSEFLLHRQSSAFRSIGRLNMRRYEKFPGCDNVKFAALDLVDNFRSSMIADFTAKPHGAVRVLSSRMPAGR
jgi:hypothetical protein